MVPSVEIFTFFSVFPVTSAVAFAPFRGLYRTIRTMCVQAFSEEDVIILYRDSTAGAVCNPIFCWFIVSVRYDGDRPVKIRERRCFELPCGFCKDYEFRHVGSNGIYRISFSYNNGASMRNCFGLNDIQVACRGRFNDFT